MDTSTRNSVIALVVGLAMGIAGSLLGFDLKGQVCNGSAPAAAVAK